jgi:hypothetical protein
LYHSAGNTSPVGLRVIENNGGTVTGTGDVGGTPPVANPTPVFTAGHSEILDGSVNVTFVINWNLSTLRTVTINGRVIIMTHSAGSVKRILSGYPGYSGNIGEAVSGSTEITLYSSFISHLAENESADGTGRQTMSASFGEGHDVSTTFTTQTSSDTPPQDDGRLSGNSGCDAGVGLISLTALGALLLRKR